MVFTSDADRSPACPLMSAKAASRRPRMAFCIIERVAAGGKHGDALASKENILGGGVARSIGFGQDVAARAIPIERTARFGDAAAVAVIEIARASGGFELALGVPLVIGDEAVAGGVAGGVISPSGQVIVAIGGGGDAVEVAPRVERVGFPPAVSGAGGEGGSCLRGDDAIQLVIREGLGGSSIEVVGNAVDDSGIVGGRWIHKIVGDIHGVATRRRGFEFIGLEAGVVGVGKIEETLSGKSNRMAFPVMPLNDATSPACAYVCVRLVRCSREKQKGRPTKPLTRRSAFIHDVS